MKYKGFLNFLLFQMVWWWTLLKIHQDDPLSVYFVQLIYLIIHLYFFAKKNEFKFIFLLSGFGFLVDLFAFYLGVFELQDKFELKNHLWLFGLWMAFSTTINHSMSWIFEYKKMSFLLFAIFGPLTYYLASLNFGIIQFTEPVNIHYSFYTLFWLLLTLVVHLLYQFFFPTQEVD